MYATLRDSAIDEYHRFVGALSKREIETCYEEMKQVALVLDLQGVRSQRGGLSSASTSMT